MTDKKTDLMTKWEKLNWLSDRLDELRRTRNTADDAIHDTEEQLRRVQAGHH